jgi:hypothetical protein
MKQTRSVRDASQGPWITSCDIEQFLTFCRSNGHQTREHPDLWTTGYQIRLQGHWMSLLWNKSFKRYTADRRLTLLVQSFAVDKKA